MYDHIDVPSEFKYPKEGLPPVQGMLSAADINNPNIKDKFPGTDLYPENLEDFLADVV